MNQLMDNNSTANINTDSRSWAERNGFSDWSLSLIWLFLCITVFQVLAGLLAAAGYLLFNSEVLAELQGTGDGLVEMITKDPDFLFAGNSTWQILFLAVGTLLFVKVQTGGRDRWSFLRLRKGRNVAQVSVLTVVLVLTVQPLVWFLGWVNAFLPVPEFFENLQQMQMEMIKNLLGNEENVLITLFHVALVPAICEEVLFRGYVMRSFERSWGVMAAIFLSGFVFGLYHMQLTNLLPLTALGVLFAYVTWVSESILPAVFAHLVNNGGSVLVATYYPETAFAEMTPETMPPVWAVAASLVISTYLIYYLYLRYKKQRLTEDTHV